jgi:hypothetical protein
MNCRDEGEEAALALSEFMHEVTVQGSLRHPNIVSILGTPRAPCIVVLIV